MAVGFDNGSVVLFRGDVLRERSEFPKFGFDLLLFSNNHFYLMFATLNFLVSFTFSDRCLIGDISKYATT